MTPPPSPLLLQPPSLLALRLPPLSPLRQLLPPPPASLPMFSRSRDLSVLHLFQSRTLAVLVLSLSRVIPSSTSLPPVRGLAMFNITSARMLQTVVAVLASMLEIAISRTRLAHKLVLVGLGRE